ncbi:DUF1413 domain-containing protein [Candidatus Parcubacteria bacterium]|jgi:hypothetical protein|nr:MAG: DUF1413 domain-containing protein [Candidatus Parcubacteria bacterium]
MATYRFDLNKEYSEKLEKLAAEKHMNVQDFIRFKIFNETTIFTVDEAVKRIQNGGFENTEFTLPDVYGEDEWTIKRGPAGVFGKNFYIHITNHPELGISFSPDRTIKRRAVYTYKRMKGDQIE